MIALPNEYFAVWCCHPVRYLVYCFLLLLVNFVFSISQFYFLPHCWSNRCLLSVLRTNILFVYWSLVNLTCQLLDGSFLFTQFLYTPYIIRCNPKPLLVLLVCLCKIFQRTLSSQVRLRLNNWNKFHCIRLALTFFNR